MGSSPRKCIGTHRRQHHDHTYDSFYDSSPRNRIGTYKTPNFKCKNRLKHPDWTQIGPRLDPDWTQIGIHVNVHIQTDCTIYLNKQPYRCNAIIYRWEVSTRSSIRQPYDSFSATLADSSPRDCIGTHGWQHHDHTYDLFYGFFFKESYWNTRQTTSWPHIRSLLRYACGFFFKRLYWNIEDSITTHTISSMGSSPRKCIGTHRRQHHDTYDSFYDFFPKESYWNT